MRNIPMCLACLLLVLVMFTTYMTSGLFARYTTSSTGNDSARVARFDVDVRGSVKDLDIFTSQNEDTGEYEIVITNHSEVVVRYDLAVDILSSVDWITGSFSSSNGVLGINDSKTIVLTFVVDENQLTAGVSGDKVEQSVNFRVVADIEQVD